MSNKIHCPHCYQSSNYISVAPKFCGYCGKSYTEAFVKPVNNPIPSESNRPEISKENIQKSRPSEIESEIPQINKIEVEVKNIKRMGEGLKSLAVGAKPEDLGRTKPKIRKNMSKEKVQEEWAKIFQKGTRDNPIQIN